MNMFNHGTTKLNVATLKLASFHTLYQALSLRASGPKKPREELLRVRLIFNNYKSGSFLLNDVKLCFENTKES